MQQPGNIHQHAVIASTTVNGWGEVRRLTLPVLSFFTLGADHKQRQARLVKKKRVASFEDAAIVPPAKKKKTRSGKWNCCRPHASENTLLMLTPPNSDGLRILTSSRLRRSNGVLKY